MLKRLIFTVLLSTSAAVSAFSVVPAYTISDISWSVTQTGTYAPCNQLVLDATGASNFSKFALAGYLICYSGTTSIAVSGSGHVMPVGAPGLLRMHLVAEGGWTIVCSNLPLSTLSGGCVIYDPSGVTAGSMSLTLR